MKIFGCCTENRDECEIAKKEVELGNQELTVEEPQREIKKLRALNTAHFYDSRRVNRIPQTIKSPLECRKLAVSVPCPSMSGTSAGILMLTVFVAVDSCCGNKGSYN